MINPTALAFLFSSAAATGLYQAAQPAMSYSSRAWERAEHYLLLQRWMRFHDNNLQSTKNFERMRGKKGRIKLRLYRSSLGQAPHPTTVLVVPPRGDQGLL